MALFTGIGDFFRGAFGEDEEEKRRRKQREAQEAAQRRAAQKPKPQPVTQPNQVKNVNDLFKVNQDKPQIKPQSPLYNDKPKPETKPVTAPKVALPDMEFKALSNVGQENKKILGQNMAWALPKSLEKRTKVAVDRTISTNKDKYIAAFDQLDKERKKILIESVKKQVKEGDKAALNTYNALVETNRIGAADDNLLQKGADIASVPGRSVLRVATGIAQGGAGVYDLLTPGEGRNRVSTFTDEVAKNQDKSAKEAGVETAYKVMNIPTEIASYFIPSTLAVKVAGKFPKGAKLTEEIVEKVAKLADDGGEANKVRQFLANRMRQNFTLEEALEEAAISARYMGQNTARGGDTSPASIATDIASGIGGGLLFPGKAIRRANLDDTNIQDEATGAALASLAEGGENVTLRNADEVADRAVQEGEKVVDDAAEALTDNERELLEIANDPDEPAYRRKQAKDELDRLAATKKAAEDAARAAEDAADPTMEPTIIFKRRIQTIIDETDREFDEYLSKNPQLTRQQIETARDAAAKRQRELVEELQKTRAAGYEALSGQQAANTAQAEAGAANVTEAQANAAARTAPKPGEVVETSPQGANPETAANDAYNKFNEEAGIDSNTSDIDYFSAQQRLEGIAGNKQLGDLEGRQAGRIPAGINEATQGRVATGVTDTAGNTAGALLGSQNPLLNTLGRFLFGMNKKSTLNDATKTLVEQVRGRRGGIGNLRGEVVAQLEAPLRNLDEATQAIVKEKVFRAFELYNNGQMDESLALIKSFAPEERAYFDGIRDLNKLRNNLNRATMPRELIDQYANGMHMPRIFDPAAFNKEFDEDAIEAFARSQNRTLDLNPNKRRKQLEEISEELREEMLRDPAQASAIRTEIALHNKGVSDYAARVGMIPDVVSDTPKKGFLEIPDQAKYGDLAGQHVRKDLAEPMLSGDARFESDTYKAINTILDKYQSSIFGKVENSLRKVLTVYNPATRIGNRAANITQGQMAGFNFPEMAVSQQHFINVLKNGGDEWTRLAQSFGAIDNASALGRASGEVTDPKNRLLKRATQSYNDVDQGAKVAMFKWRIQKGSTPEEAARFVNRALPNIGNSGEIYSFFSRLPVLGTPFRAIQPEVLRSLTSTAGRNTVPFLTAMTVYTTLQNMSYEGVPEEERQQIQERFGSGQTPFAGINKFFGERGVATDKVLPSSWSFNAAGIPGIKELFATDPETGDRPVVDVDPRRLMGIYSINLGGESPADSLIDTALKASPVNLPVSYNDGQFSFEPQNVVSSRTFAPLWQAAIDTDFRGKSIQDPEGKIYNEEGGVDLKFLNPETGQPEAKSDPRRLLEFLGRSYIPQGSDVANVVDAKKGEENFYGQEMNVAQAVGRFFGLKGEEFNDERLQDMRETEQYFDERKYIDGQVLGLSTDEQNAYKALTGYYKLREEVPNEFEPGSSRYKKAPVFNFGEDKWKEYASHPKLYGLMIEKKRREFEANGTPIPPEFDERLSDAFRKQIIQNKMVAPGDDAELDQRMYSSPEWDYYMNLKDQYRAKAKEYYPDDGNDDFTDELVKHQDAPFPQKPDILKQYSAAYAAYTNGKVANKPEFTDQLKAAKDQYNQLTFSWTNNERKARGLPPINWEMWNNPTFGYDESPSGFGFGFGGGGDGSARPYQTNVLGNLTNFSSTVKGYDPIEAAAMPQIMELLRRLQAPRRGGRANVPIGASSRGQ